jgi:FAD/FMN-containing dehydrogenase
MTTTTDFDDSILDDLAGQLRGVLLRPGDDGYDDARAVWNGRFDARPDVVVRTHGTADVVAAVDFARDEDLRVSVKGGGHDYAGNPVRDGGLLIDLSPMDAVRVDPDAETARVEPGATWADFDHEAQAFGLATTGATVSTVGVPGYTLGGGTGHLARTHGLAVDNLLAVDVVTADGELVHASENENTDLFWALRGGSGNFGIVTSFEFALHRVGPELLAGQIVHPFEEATGVLEFYRSFMADAPDEVNCYAFVVPVPPLPAFPEERHGEPAINLVVSYSGRVDAGEAALRPLRAFGDPILDGVRPQQYTEFQRAFDDGAPAGERWYSKAQYLDGLPDDAIDTIVTHTEALPGPMTMVYLEPMGGAIGRVEPSATAFPHRDAAYSVHILPGWRDPDRDGELVDWAREFHDALDPYATGGEYVNLLGRDEADRIGAAYGRNYDRLVEIKRERDPENLFSSNQNIDPNARGTTSRWRRPLFRAGDTTKRHLRPSPRPRTGLRSEIASTIWSDSSGETGSSGSNRTGGPVARSGRLTVRRTQVRPTLTRG